MRHIKDLKHLERKGEPGQGAKRRHPHGHPTKRRQRRGQHWEEAAGTWLGLAVGGSLEAPRSTYLPSQSELCGPPSWPPHTSDSNVACVSGHQPG